MAGDLYDGWAEPCGVYASRLEARWAREFGRWGWPARYVGDRLTWADFFLAVPGLGLPVEVKPQGAEFLGQALVRADGRTRELIVVQDSPDFAVWTYVRAKSDGWGWDRWPAGELLWQARERLVGGHHSRDEPDLERFAAALRALSVPSPAPRRLA
jgi:hypothetical protein